MTAWLRHLPFHLALAPSVRASYASAACTMEGARTAPGRRDSFWARADDHLVLLACPIGSSGVERSLRQAKKTSLFKERGKAKAETKVMTDFIYRAFQNNRDKNFPQHHF